MNGMMFVNPKKTASLSVTGRACSLNCAHCGGHYLRHMLPPGLWHTLDPAIIKSCLISGGCDPSGRVPVLSHKQELLELSRNFSLNFHVGLVTGEEAREIALMASVISFDFVVDDATIREVYGIQRSGDDYIQTYQMLRNSARVIPHICVGLLGGKVSGEYAAIDALCQLGAEAIVFLVLIPTLGTKYSGISPPPVNEVVGVMQYAMKAMPGTPIYLGCMRPRGRYRAEIDQAAVRLGVSRIVAPAHEAVMLAEKYGFRVTWGDECCVLNPDAGLGNDIASAPLLGAPRMVNS